jgi:hypothetical protein
MSAHGENNKQETQAGVAWIKEGRRFSFDDLVTYSGKNAVAFADVAHKIDLILTGPHATAAFPAEMAPFIDASVTRRKQFDYSDVTTNAIAKRWAEIDERVVYIANPHPRLVFDQNRPHPVDPEKDLREIFNRIRNNQAGQKRDYAGVDSVRPVTFAAEPIIKQPATNEQWRMLLSVLMNCAANGAFVYAKVRDEVTNTVFEKKCATLQRLPVEKLTVPQFHSALSLQVQCFHDTMNARVFPDGAVANIREPAERLSLLVCLSNRGNAKGEAKVKGDGSRLAAGDVLTIRADQLIGIKRAYQTAFDIANEKLDDTIALNRPYYGGYEVQILGDRLRAMARESVVTHKSGIKRLSLTTGAYQAEYLRETLLGPENTAIISQPGTGWPDENPEHINELAEKLKAAYDILRLWGFHTK